MENSYLTGPFVGSHLEANGGVVHGGLDVHLGVIQVPPCAIGIHACLTGALVSAHLLQHRTGILKSEREKKKKKSPLVNEQPRLITPFLTKVLFFMLFSYLKPNHTLSSFHLLLTKGPLLLVCILHPNVHRGLKAFSLGLQETQTSRHWRGPVEVCSSLATMQFV